MQEAIVAIIVLYAFWVIVRRYAPGPIKRRVRLYVTRFLTRLGWTSMAAKIDAGVSSGGASSGACGACGGCGSDDADAASQEFRISPSAIKHSKRSSAS